MSEPNALFKQVGAAAMCTGSALFVLYHCLNLKPARQSETESEQGIKDQKEQEGADGGDAHKTIARLQQLIQFVQFPPPSPRFAVDDLVCVLQDGKPKTARRALVTSELLCDGQNAGRHEIAQIAPGTTYHHKPGRPARPKNLIKVFNPNRSDPVLVLVCKTTDQFRRLARTQVGTDDVALELGTCCGHAAFNMAAAGATVLAVDKSEEYLAQAKARQHLPEHKDLPGTIRFECLDALDEAMIRSLPQLVHSNSFDVVFLDINGTRELETVVRALDQVRAVLAPKLVVVKSKQLFSSLFHE